LLSERNTTGTTQLITHIVVINLIADQ
jgi:hypothetical protein